MSMAVDNPEFDDQALLMGLLSGYEGVESSMAFAPLIVSILYSRLNVSLLRQLAAAHAAAAEFAKRLSILRLCVGIA